jgi:hypothetical protein
MNVGRKLADWSACSSNKINKKKAEKRDAVIA